MSKKVAFVLSHWHHPFDGLQESPQSFYKALEEGITKRAIPDGSVSRIEYREGGVFSAEREYLRVERQRLVFDVCAAPFGNGFFVSWWMGEVRSFWATVAMVIILFVTNFIFAYSINKAGVGFGIIIGLMILFGLLWLSGYLIREGIIEITLSPSEIPLFGKVYDFVFKPVTYYRIDTTLMFEDTVHAAVLEAIDRMTGEKGYRSLTELERKPIHKDLFRR